MRIGVRQFPDVDNPTVTVSVSWPGASPEDVETGLVNPIEDVLAQVTGVQEITSTARQNSARITATFDISRDIDLALQDMQAKVAQIQRKLPTGVQPPTVSKSNPDDHADHHGRRVRRVPAPAARRRRALPDRGRARDAPRRRPGDDDGLPRSRGPDLGRRRQADRDRHDRHRHHERADEAARDVVGRSDDERPEGDRRPRARRGRRPRRRCATSSSSRHGDDAITRLGDVALVQDGFEDITVDRAHERRAGAGDGHPQAAGLERGRGRERRPRRRSPTSRRPAARA